VVRKAEGVKMCGSDTQALVIARHRESAPTGPADNGLCQNQCDTRNFPEQGHRGLPRMGACHNAILSAGIAVFENIGGAIDKVDGPSGCTFAASRGWKKGGRLIVAPGRDRRSDRPLP